MTFKETYPGAAFNEAGRHVGPGPWLDVIRTANGLMEEFLGTNEEPPMFGAPTYTDDRLHVEQYPDADVTHDYPVPEKPALPDDDGAFGSREWERIARERARIHDEWLRDPRNTVTITSKTPLGERLLRRAHDVVVNPFEVVGVVSYDPETDTLLKGTDECPS